jgi:hypothetical protein
MRGWRRGLSRVCQLFLCCDIWLDGPPIGLIRPERVVVRVYIRIKQGRQVGVAEAHARIHLIPEGAAVHLSHGRLSTQMH